MNYNATGSGAGIKQFNAGQVDFAGSDSALKTTPADGATTSEAQDAQKRCSGNPAWNLPMVIGPIAVAYNLSGVDKLVLTPDVVAKIFNGKITTWNDPAIATLNTGVTLPEHQIKVFFRSDESGHDRELPEVPQGRGAQRLDVRPRQEVAGEDRARARRSPPASPGRQEHRRVASPTSSGPTRRTSSWASRWIDNGGGPVQLTADSAGKAISAAKVSRHGQRPDAQARLRHEAARGLPDRPGHLRDRLLQGARRRQDRAAEGVPQRTSSAPPVQTDVAGIGYAPLPAEVATKVQTSINAIS